MDRVVDHRNKLINSSILATQNFYVYPVVPILLRPQFRSLHLKGRFESQGRVLTQMSFLSFQKIVFEGVVGKSYQGDIAVDDLKLIKSPCPLPGDCYLLIHFINKIK